MFKTLTSLTLIVALAVGATSCTQRVKAAEQVFIDCSKADIGQVLAQDGMALFQEVLAIIMAGGNGWQAALEQVGMTGGKDALACAVEAVKSLLVAHADGSPATAALSPQAARALAFIASHPEWKFVDPTPAPAASSK